MEIRLNVLRLIKTLAHPLADLIGVIPGFRLFTRFTFLFQHPHKSESLFIRTMPTIMHTVLVFNLFLFPETLAAMMPKEYDTTARNHSTQTAIKDQQGATNAHSTQAEFKIAECNRNLYESLKTLSENEMFSKVKMTLSESCPFSTGKCNALSCSISSVPFKSKNGFIDLLKTRESYSQHSDDGALVWSHIYDYLKNHQDILRLVSGLHYSVTTHISAFHTPIFGFYFNDPRYFRKRFREDYQKNYEELYRLYVTAMAEIEELLDGEMENLPKEFFSLIGEAKKYKSHTLPWSKEAEQKPTFSKSIAFSGQEPIAVLSELAKMLGCLKCQKCRLWGTIQVKGIRAAVKILHRAPLTRNDLICFVNGFRRLSVTERESRKMMKQSMSVLNYMIIYYYPLTIIVASLSVLSLTLYKSRKVNRYVTTKFV